MNEPLRRMGLAGALSLSALLIILALAPRALADGIQMIPPLQGGIPCPVGSSRVLTWDGSTAMACVSNFTADANSNVGIGGTLNVTGAATFMGNVGIGAASLIDPQTGQNSPLSIIGSSPQSILVENTSPFGWSEIKFIDDTDTAQISIGYNNDPSDTSQAYVPTPTGNVPHGLGAYVLTEQGEELDFVLNRAIEMQVTNSGVTIQGSTATAATVDTANALAAVIASCAAAGGGTLHVNSAGQLSCP